MAIIKVFNIENFEQKVSDFIFNVCGLRPYEKDDVDKYRLCLGTSNPIEIGFYYAKHPDQAKETMRYSAHIKLLMVFAEQMKGDHLFLLWVQDQLDSLN